MANTKPQDFFNTRRTASEIKTELLPVFFEAWRTLLSENYSAHPAENILFIDLNAGPGYDQETPTAPLKILTTTSNNPDASSNPATSVKYFFADESKTATEKLQEHIAQLSGDSENQPVILQPENQPEFISLAAQENLHTFVANDPFSYAFAQEVTSLLLARDAIDFYMLFPLSKLKKAVLADTVPLFVSQLFGDKLPEIRSFREKQSQGKRLEEFMLAAFAASLKEKGFNTLKFKINSPKSQASQYLFIGTKNKAFYFKSKEILAAYSDCQEDGVPLWGVNLNYQPPSIPGFSKFIMPYCLENLVEELSQKKSLYHYKTIQEIYEAHSLQTPYIPANYLTAFEQLRLAGRINLINEQNKQAKKITLAAIVFYKLHSSTKI